jgi:hypothetical protein
MCLLVHVEDPETFGAKYDRPFPEEHEIKRFRQQGEVSINLEPLWFGKA